MAIISIGLAVVFSVVISIVEIPTMKQKKLYRECVLFVVFLVFGITITILKSFDIQIINPADIVAAIFSPFSNLLKGALE